MLKLPLAPFRRALLPQMALRRNYVGPESHSYQLYRSPLLAIKASTDYALGRHHGSSFSKYQKSRARKTKCNRTCYLLCFSVMPVYVAAVGEPGADRLGKVHSEPGMRLAAKIESSHLLEAAFEGDRLPAMWNHQAYVDMYNELTALPEVDNGPVDLLSCNPDILLQDLRSRSKLLITPAQSTGNSGPSDADDFKLYSLNPAPSQLSPLAGMFGPTTFSQKNLTIPEVTSSANGMKVSMRCAIFTFTILLQVAQCRSKIGCI